MNPMMDMILNAAGGGVLQKVASQFGLDESQAASAIGALLPALTNGVERNVSEEGGLGSLLGALSGGNHEQYLDDPSTLSDPSTVDDGNSILGHLLGSKEASREVAAQASQQTGLGTDLLKQMLPVVASLAMGALARRSQGSNMSGMMQGGQSGGVMDMLGSFLAGKIFGRG